MLNKNRNHKVELMWLFLLFVATIMSFSIYAKSSSIDQAYDAYQQAFDRYTSMVTNAKTEDEATVQEALEAYRNTYARYKKLKEAGKQSSLNPPEENNTLDASGIDGIVAIDPSDVENNIEYIESLRERSNTEINKNTKLPLGTNCNSKKFKRLLDKAETQTEKDHFKEALKLYRQAHGICPMKNIEEQMAWLLSQIKTPESGHEQLVLSAKDQVKVINLPAKAKTIVPNPFDVISKVITKKGGVISDSMMRLHVPPQAVLKNKKIVVKRIHGLLPKGRSNNQVSLPEAKQIGTAYDFGPDGIRFKKAVTITIKYKEKDIPAGMIESNLFLVYYDGEKWVKINSFHDKKTNTFTTSVKGFPGSIIVTVGVPFIAVSGGYALITGKHKKVYQLFWDPIKENWIHKFIKPDSPTVKKYAKRIGIRSERGKNNKITSFDDPEKLAVYLKKNLTNKRPELLVGFTGKHNENKFTDITDKYISEADTVEPVKNYLNKIDSKEDKYGDCIDVANTFVSILRSKGYQIKGVSGYIKGKPHAWSEVIIGSDVYGIDEYGRISKLDYLKKHVTYPKKGDPYRKEWDEKGTRPYNPTILIKTPGKIIYAGDGKKYVFTLKTFGLPKKTLFSWNFNNLGNSIKSRKKSFVYKFEATGKYKLKATAFLDGKKLSQTITINVKGKEKVSNGDLRLNGNLPVKYIEISRKQGKAELKGQKLTAFSQTLKKKAKFKAEMKEILFPTLNPPKPKKIKGKATVDSLAFIVSTYAGDNILQNWGKSLEEVTGLPFIYYSDAQDLKYNSSNNVYISSSIFAHTSKRVLIGRIRNNLIVVSINISTEVTPKGFGLTSQSSKKIMKIQMDELMLIWKTLKERK